MIDWKNHLTDARERGLSAAELARELGVPPVYAATAARRHGVILRDGRADNGPKVAERLTNHARIERLRALASAGYLQVEAAEIEGITRERVRQIANKRGIIFREYSQHIADFFRQRPTADEA